MAHALHCVAIITDSDCERRQPSQRSARGEHYESVRERARLDGCWRLHELDWGRRPDEEVPHAIAECRVCAKVLRIREAQRERRRVLEGLDLLWGQLDLETLQYNMQSATHSTDSAHSEL